MLRALIETYLRECGFTDTVYSDGETYWGHLELGLGRTFDQALHWQLGREVAASLA